ncbi:MAG: dihydroneopterin aldolase [Chitinophagaceae bacterium]
MLSVQLFDLNFHAFHGLYAEEAKVGSNFQVNLTVNYDEERLAMNDINSLINYEVLYDIVKKRMAIPSNLLEEVADTIILKIRHKYSMVKDITISIFKLQAPIENFQGKVGITLKKQFE